jgi:hypothetical protein
VFYGQDRSGRVTALSELVQTLPNGLHDAELRTFAVDLSQGSLTMDLDVWVGDMDDLARREAYRVARLTLGGLRYFVVDPPGTASWLEGPSVRIDVGFDPPPRSTSTTPEPPSGCYSAWFFLGELNSFMHTIAETAALEWHGGERLRRHERP